MSNTNENIKIRPKTLVISSVKAVLGALIWLLLNTLFNSTDTFYVENIWLGFALFIPSFFIADLVGAMISAQMTISNFERIFKKDS